MESLQTASAPHPRVVLPHYIYAALSFLVLTIFIILSTDSLIGHFFKPKLLAITHIATLGWITMIIFGALYQLLPVISGTALFSEKLASITFYIFGTGIILLVYTFWTFKTGVYFIISGSFVFLAFLMFAYNILLTVIKSPKKEIESIFISLSSIYLMFTGLLGILLVINFTFPIFKQSHFLFLSVHAHIGIVGWFLFLIIGASSKLVPMFLISHKLNRKKLQISFYSLNLGLILLSLNWMIFHINLLKYVSYIFVLVGLISFISYLYESYKKRVRKVLDIGMKHTMVAFLIVALPLVLGFIAIAKFNLSSSTISQVIILYGFSIIIGIITSLILGQTYKTLPFIVWLSIYQKHVGKARIPLPKDLYSEKILLLQYIGYAISLVLLFVGILTSLKTIILLGSIMLLIVAILYNINVFSILLHKPRIEKIEK